MPLIQRNSLTFSNLVYSTGNYSNPQWITSLSPAKVGSGVAQWNAAQLQGQNVSTGIPYTGAALAWNGQWMASGTPIPMGGLEGQIMSKGSDSNYDIQWIDNYAPDVRIICKNDSGENILRGQAVMAVDAVGDRIRIAKSVANGTVNPRYMLGVAYENINNGSEGYVTLLGEVTNINTDAYNVGDILWLNPATPGGFTATEPGDSSVRMAIAIVTRKQTSSGRIFVRMWTQQPSLIDLFDVAIDAPASGHVISYHPTSGNWYNVPASSLVSVYSASSGVTLSGTNFTLGGTGTLNELSLRSTGTRNSINVFDSSGVARTWIDSSGYINQSVQTFSIGIGSGVIVPTGKYNLIIGDNAGYRLHESSTYNTIITLGVSDSTKKNWYPVGSGYNNVVIGRSAGLQGECKNNVYIAGTSYDGAAGSPIIEGTGNMVIGTINFKGSNSVIIGEATSTRLGIAGTVPTVDYSVHIGYAAGNELSRQAGTGICTKNIFIGVNAGQTASGSNNIGIGENALGGWIYGVIGNNNLEIITAGNNRIQGLFGNVHNNKLNIQRMIAGDSSTYRMTMGYVSQSGHFNPDSTIQIVPRNASDKVLIVRGATSQSANLLELQDVNSNSLFTITSQGAIYPNFSRGSGNYIIGSPTTFTNTSASSTGTFNIAIGSGAIQYFTTGTNFSTAVGHQAGFGGGNYSVWFGYRAGHQSDLLSGSDYCVTIGAEAFIRQRTTGNIAIGYGAKVAYSGHYNVVIGYDAGSLFATGVNNCIFIGDNTFNYIALPTSEAVAIGSKAAQETAGRSNCITDSVIVGARAAQGNRSGIANTYIGKIAGQNTYDGSGNVAVGYSAGSVSSYTNATGCFNVSLGYNATRSAHVSNSIALGANTLATQTGQLIIGSSTNKIGKSDGTGEQAVSSVSPSGLSRLLQATINGTTYQIPLLPSGATDLTRFNNLIVETGVVLNSGVPAVITNALYSSGSILHWNGQPVLTGVVSGGGTTTNALTFGSGLSLSSASSFNGSAAVTAHLGGTGLLSSLNVFQTSSGDKTLVVRSASGQTQSVLEAQNSSSAVLFSVSPNGSLGSVLQTGNTVGFSLKGGINQSQNYIEVQNASGNVVFAVTPSGSMSGTIAPSISGTSSNVTLDDSHNGYIIEYTGTSSGTITLGSISMPSWNCMVVNIGSGLSISGGSNTVRSPGNLLKSRTQYSSISIYRRANGEFLLGGDLA